jgi:hypothetical protein
MLTLSFNGSDERLAQSLRARGPQIIQAVMRKMDELMFRLQAKIVGEKLAGQVLQQRTGKLAGSIRAIPTTLEGTEVTGAVEGGGGPAFYGRVQEYGGRGPYTIVPINKSALTFLWGGKQVFFKKVTHPPLQSRSFMRSSLEESRELIFAGLRESVRQELAK